jgi:TatA/E family protein of Tat protein translocase
VSERRFAKVFFLILESLGSTELVFILVMALVFFGPRKLPQLSRTLGKNLASFRRASEDFKRTWDREASLEEFSLTDKASAQSILPEQNSIFEHAKPSETFQAPTIEPIASDRVIPRQTNGAEPPDFSSATDPVEPAEPLSKRDWL